MEISKDLGNSSITLVGLGTLGSYVLRSLIEVGIRKIKIIDPDQVDEREISLGFYAEEDLGRLHCDVWQKRFDELTMKVQTSVEFSSADVRNLTPVEILNTDLVVLCSETEAILLHEYINEICLENKSNWFSVRYLDNIGELGPLVISDQTACYECYILRLKSNQEVKVAPKELRQIDERQSDLEILEQLKIRITAGYACLEISRYFSNVGRSVTIGGILSINFKNYKNSIHRLLRVPNCPGCERSIDSKPILGD